MNVYLSDCFDTLHEAEIKRLQKLLKVILMNKMNRGNLKRTLSTIYQHKGQPSDILAGMNNVSRKIFLKLLKNFGYLTVDKISEDEKKHLIDNPLAIWLNNRVCTVPVEAFELFANDKNFRKYGFLYTYLANLPKKEKKAWARWLKIDDFISSEKMINQKLYSEMARIRCSDREVNWHKLFPFSGSHLSSKIHRATSSPLYLDQFFPDDPMKCQVAWFYRDVLTLYDALAETEKRMKNWSIADEVCDLLYLLKTGRVIIEKEKPEFGEKQRCRLVRSWESKYPVLPHNTGIWNIDSEGRENFLF